jgi:hypothetical protein
VVAGVGVVVVKEKYWECHKTPHSYSICVFMYKLPLFAMSEDKHQHQALQVIYQSELEDLEARTKERVNIYRDEPPRGQQ